MSKEKGSMVAFENRCFCCGIQCSIVPQFRAILLVSEETLAAKMHTFLQRLNALVTFAITVLAAMCIAATMTGTWTFISKQKANTAILADIVPCN